MTILQHRSVGQGLVPLVTLFLLTTFTACSPNFYFTRDLAIPAAPSPSPSPTVPTSCNPFSGGIDPQIWGTMFYYPGSDPDYVPSTAPGAKVIASSSSAINNLATMFANSLDFPVNFFFSQINVPNQPFSNGFTITSPDGTQSLLTYPSSTIEINSYFGITFHSDLLLPNTATQTAYQFAVSSDDGAIMYLSQTDAIGPTSPTTMVVNNDGTHAVTTSCSTSSVTLSKTDLTHMRLDWYQGPPYYLGVILYYRPWVDNRCDLSNSSWNVVPANWFNLPADAPVPSCN